MNTYPRTRGIQPDAHSLVRGKRAQNTCRYARTPTNSICISLLTHELEEINQMIAIILTENVQRCIQIFTRTHELDMHMCTYPRTRGNQSDDRDLAHRKCVQSLCVCVCVRVRKRERKREGECVRDGRSIHLSQRATACCSVMQCDAV